MIFTKDNWLPIGSIFKVNGKSYQLESRRYNTNKQEWKFIIKSLFDNGKKYPFWESELKEKLKQHRSENVSIFGRG